MDGQCHVRLTECGCGLRRDGCEGRETDLSAPGIFGDKRGRVSGERLDPGTNQRPGECLPDFSGKRTSASDGYL